MIDALTPSMPVVDLLDAQNYRSFAKHGLRGAFLWLGGSSIASLLFLDQIHDAATALIICATVGLGAYSLVWPLRGVHRLIARAKEDELVRVREWPMDVPTFARFALLVAVALGSWLGGAVVEVLLDAMIGS